MAQIRHAFRLGMPLVIMSFPTEQCSVCGVSCSYLTITDEVGEFDIFTAGYCLMPPTEYDLI